MMRKIFGLFSSVALLAATSSMAYAADAINVITQEKFEQRWSWTGFHAGLEAGYSWQSDTTGNALACFVPACEAHGDGDIFGVFAGYNYQFDNGVVIGAEASYTHHGVMFDDGSQVEIKDAYALAARLGYGFGRINAYGLLGGVYGTTETNNPGLPAAVNDELSQSDWGVVFGFGVDVAIAESLIAGVQFTRQQYNDFADMQPFGLDADIDAKVDSLKLRVGYQF